MCQQVCPSNPIIFLIPLAFLFFLNLLFYFIFYFLFIFARVDQNMEYFKVKWIFTPITWIFCNLYFFLSQSHFFNSEKDHFDLYCICNVFSQTFDIRNTCFKGTCSVVKSITDLDCCDRFIFDRLIYIKLWAITTKNLSILVLPMTKSGRDFFFC